MKLIILLPGTLGLVSSIKKVGNIFLKNIMVIFLLGLRPLKKVP
jgi:hypothetical protein